MDKIDPKDFIIHPFQVAGHGTLLTFKGPDGSHRVLKEFRQSEADFYEFTKRPEADPIREWIPKYYGSMEFRGSKWLILEDLTGGYEKPCVFDMKIGTTQHYPDMEAEKMRIAIEKCATSTSGRMGMRMCGAKIYKKSTDSFIFLDRAVGCAYSNTGLRTQGLQYFLHDGERFHLEVAQAMADSVNRLLQAFPLSGGGIRYISSSLLFVYDSASPNPNTKWKVRMIDFAHATPQLEYPFPPGDTIDKDYLYGLTSLNIMFQEILKSKGEDVATPDGI